MPQTPLYPIHSPLDPSPPQTSMWYTRRIIAFKGHRECRIATTNWQLWCQHCVKVLVHSPKTHRLQYFNIPFLFLLMSLHPVFFLHLGYAQVSSTQTRRKCPENYLFSTTPAISTQLSIHQKWLQERGYHLGFLIFFCNLSDTQKQKHGWLPQIHDGDNTLCC